MADAKPAYVFTISGDKLQSNISQNIFEIPIDQDQGEWHWIYFGYNK